MNHMLAPDLRRSYLTLALVLSAVGSADDDIRIERGVVYGKAGNEDLLADLYRPAAESHDAPRPAVLMIHGGGFAEGSRESKTVVKFANALAHAGFAALSIDYRLVRDADDQTSLLNQWPAAIEDSRAAVQWLRTNAGKLDLDPARIGACGDSAGGLLVSLLATTEAAKPGAPSTRVQAAVDIYGPADLTQPFPQLAIPLFSIGKVYTVQQLVDRFVGEGDIERQREASPMFHIDERTAPILIVHGTEDALVPVEQARRFHAALQKAGRPAELVLFDGENHGFTPETDEQVINRTIAFFQKHLIAEATGETAQKLRTAGAARQDEKPVDWMGIFQIHYDNRVRAFKEQNQQLQNVVLVGDSITEGFDVPTYFPGRRVLNRGIGGDVIGNALPESDQRGLLRRLENSVLDCAPSHVFLLIGVNDLNSGRKPDVMEAGYRELLTRIKQQSPRTTVYVQSLLPTGRQHTQRNADILDFNARLQTLAAEFDYEYVDLHALMNDDQGELKSEFTEDGLHLTAPAYRLWVAEIERRLGWAN
ncbi:MAG: GDSL-type esterase/lipase family protein [Planctomycetaceae bacterium]